MEKNIVEEVNNILDGYLENTKPIFDRNDEPLPHSQAKEELITPPFDFLVGSAYTTGGILAETVADYIFAIIKTYTEPVTTMAPCLLFRGVMETSSVALWLTDIAINSRIRVQRFLSYEFNLLDEQRKFAQMKSDIMEEERVTNRIIEKAKIAESLGVEIQYRRTGRIVAIGERMPSYTELIDKMIKAEPYYRIFSSIVHGHVTSIMQLCFKKVSTGQMIYDNTKGGLLEKELKPPLMFLISKFSLIYFAKMKLMHMRLFGWDEKEFVNLTNLSLQNLKNVILSYPLDH